MWDEFDDLRLRYEMWMERIEFTQVELLNPRRIAWFKHDLASTYFNAKDQPTIRAKAATFRTLYARHLATSAATGWTVEGRPPFQIIKSRKWGAESEDPGPSPVMVDTRL
ncbi:hypothetical protein AB0N06_35940 [Streptomyces sp. NPDC051020]|uniref:hypothetical protein n=1 Tax=Streptomyces sp. NPDC051020 TaxID=3155409 RepID=UPI00342921AF